MISKSAPPERGLAEDRPRCAVVKTVTIKRLAAVRIHNCGTPFNIVVPHVDGDGDGECYGLAMRSTTWLAALALAAAALAACSGTDSKPTTDAPCRYLRASPESRDARSVWSGEIHAQTDDIRGCANCHPGAGLN